MSPSILVPLDGSNLAEQALPTAVALVKRRHSRLELALVHEQSGYDGLADAPWNAMSESMQQRYVSDKAEQLSNVCEGAVGHALLRGDVEDEICKRACAVQADMIVMCSHGRTGLTRALTGSVADGVVRRSHVPVLLLRPLLASGLTRIPPLAFSTILVPIDESARSRQIFDAAITLAKPGHTRFVLLRVVPPVHHVLGDGLPYGYISGPLDNDATALLVEQAEHDLAGAANELARGSRCEVNAQVVVSDAAGTAIVDHARKFGADLIAMTTHGRGLSRMVLGSVTDSVLRASTIPLLVLRPPVTSCGTPS